MNRVLPDMSNVYIIGGERFVIPHQVSESIDIMQKWDQERIDKMKVELDRLRWHYIKDDEYPPNDGDMDFIAECICDIHFPKDLDYYRIKSYKDYYWISGNIYVYFDEIQRWRYTE